MRISDWSSDVCSSDLSGINEARSGQRSSDRRTVRCHHRPCSVLPNPPRLPHIRRLRGGARLSFRLSVAASLRMDLLKTPMTRVSGKQLANLSECADFARFPAPPVRPATITASLNGGLAANGADAPAGPNHATARPSVRSPVVDRSEV